MIMGKITKTTAGLLCLILLCLMAGCGGPAQKDAADSFTLEDLARCNTYDVVFGEYSSVRTESKYYDFELPAGGRGDFTQTAFFIKGSGGVSTYTDFSFGFAYAVEGRNVYHNDDGKYSVLAFFDDGFYEEAYLPVITKWIAYAPTEGEEVISCSVEGGIRKLVTNARASAEEDFATWGIPDGTIETHYELDAKSGLLLRDISYLITDDGSRRVMGEGELHYGKDDNFQPPEYVLCCRDKAETRTVRFVRDPNTPQEKAFTFTLPKGIDLSPATVKEYEYFTDTECTALYEWDAGDYPDELTLYMKEKAD
jgi:hypothetical protein